MQATVYSHLIEEPNMCLIERKRKKKENMCLYKHVILYIYTHYL